MDMNRSFNLRKEDRNPVWRVIDASDKVLGRLSTEIADALRGKDKAIFTPHQDAGDYVVVINCEKIKLTGDKWNNKIYTWYTGWRSGQKSRTATEMFEKDPAKLIIKSVTGMLPKNILSRQLIKKLKVYVGENHPHTAQINSK